MPTNPWGRVVGSGVILIGITFLSFLTATVTSLFVSNDQERKAAEEAATRAASETETRALLLRLDERLDAIEAKPQREVIGNCRMYQEAALGSTSQGWRRPRYLSTSTSATSGCSERRLGGFRGGLCPAPFGVDGERASDAGDPV